MGDLGRVLEFRFGWVGFAWVWIFGWLREGRLDFDEGEFWGILWV